MQFKDIIGQRPIHRHLADLVQNNRLSHALLFLGKEGNGSLATALAFSQFVVCETINGKHTAKSEPSLFESPSGVQRQPANNHNTEFIHNAEPGSVSLEQTPDSCGKCSACIKAQQFVHPDIHFSYPVITQKNSKTVDKPKSVDFIQEWREFLKIHPYGNAYDWLQFLGAENKQGNITAHECGDIIRKLSLKSFESEFKILIMWMPEYLGNEGNKLLKLIEEPPSNTLFIFVAENELLVLPTILSRCQ
ncbi:MAG: hypothetical protein WKF89_18905, partial [Chitinophagaceae bacterium]